jgi:hypothetical protein
VVCVALSDQPAVSTLKKPRWERHFSLHGELRESLKQGHRKLVKAIKNIVMRGIMFKVQYILRSYDVVLTLVLAKYSTYILRYISFHSYSASTASIQSYA